MIKSFGSLIGDGKKYLAKKTTPNKEAVFCVFKEVVQEYFGKIGVEKLVPDCFFNGDLFIQAQSSVWSSELLDNRTKIAQKINKRLGDVFIKNIKIKNQ